MRKFWLKTILLILVVPMVGCSSSKKIILSGKSVYVNNASVGKAEDNMTLECQSAHRLGCRYKGRTYPWNAWIELQGYSSKQFEVVDVRQSGNKAVVQIVKR